MAIKRWIVVSVAVAVAVYAGLFLYVVASQRFEYLLVCADQGGLAFPWSKQICRAYLFSFRGTETDINELQAGVGASFVMNGESTLAEREQILKFLFGKGLDINHIDMHGFTPLHGAVLDNSADEVSLLLRNGANASQRDKKYGLTPLEFALKLQKGGRQPVDRQAVIAVLQTATSESTLRPSD